MDHLVLFLTTVAGVSLILRVLNHVAYHHLKNRVLQRQGWDLNVCCGKTDGGGINVDIVRHADVPNFLLVNDIYNLPFRDGEFQYTLCSHVMEHVDDPEAFFAELQRVSRHVVLLLPPVWDLGAAFNLFEHKWLFLTWNTEHASLPRHVRLPLAEGVQNVLGQRVRA
jgi:SAM-dependent methyltransferase